jgi:signal transduction histidine kinase
LAVLSMDLQMLNRAEARHGNVEGFVQTALSRTRNIVNSVRDISHRLHPAKLRLVGLVPSLSSLQREFSQADLVITFSHENVPDALPHDVTLCLFRIVQEALQNAVKHSGAHEVSVRLCARQDGLALTIADDGVGFDLADAWDKGLGLISMGERLESVGGILKIESGPGLGTRLEITVALGPQPAAIAV